MRRLVEIHDSYTGVDAHLRVEVGGQAMSFQLQEPLTDRRSWKGRLSDSRVESRDGLNMDRASTEHCPFSGEFNVDSDMGKTTT